MHRGGKKQVGQPRSRTEIGFSRSVYFGKTVEGTNNQERKKVTEKNPITVKDGETPTYTQENGIQKKKPFPGDTTGRRFQLQITRRPLEYEGQHGYERAVHVWGGVTDDGGSI